MYFDANGWSLELLTKINDGQGQWISFRTCFELRLGQTCFPSSVKSPKIPNICTVLPNVRKVMTSKGFLCIFIREKHKDAIITLHGTVDTLNQRLRDNQVPKSNRSEQILFLWPNIILVYSNISGQRLFKEPSIRIYLLTSDQKLISNLISILEKNHRKDIPNGKRYRRITFLNRLHKWDSLINLESECMYTNVVLLKYRMINDHQ